MCTSSVVFAFAWWRQCARRHSAVSSAEMAEPSDLPFGLWTRVGQRNRKFSCIRQVVPLCSHGRAHWRHLANAVEPSVCSGYAALCQITLTTCFSYCWISHVDFGSGPSDHYFRSVCWFVCLFVCAKFFSAVFDPISIKLGHMLYVWV